MPVIAVGGAKGGVGASLVAVNLAVGLAEQKPTLLLDMVPAVGSCDLLLDLSPRRSWRDLLPVASELSERHLELSIQTHESGLSLLAAPEAGSGATDGLVRLVAALAERWSWLVLDAGSGVAAWRQAVIEASDWTLLVVTPDPPALRAAARWVQATAATGNDERRRLVINQISSSHPANPTRTAESLGLPFLAALPLDRAAVGAQVHFGRPALLDPESRLGAAVRVVVDQLVQLEAGDETEVTQSAGGGDDDA